MLSRRNIRIKIMQLLYAKSRDKELTNKALLLRYNDCLEQSYVLYLFNLELFCQIAQFASKDYTLRSAKLLPSSADKAFRPKLSENDLLDSLKKNEYLKAELNRLKISDTIIESNVKSIYNEFLKGEEYKKFIDQESSAEEDHRKILLDLYRHCVNSELFVEMIDDEFTNWIDDKSLVVGAIKKTIKALPIKESFLEDYKPADDTAVDFGETMLHKVLDDDEKLLEIIEPNLKNWDAERVAIIDMVLLKMAIAELLIFPTIPTKVTLNEFVEISKMYSTDKSKDFINGILDRLMKKLSQEGKILKKGRGLID